MEKDVKLKFDETRWIYSRDWCVKSLYELIIDNQIYLHPIFRTDNTWNDKKRGLFIESLILGIPTPEIIIATTKNDNISKFNYIIVDGYQRLSTLMMFLNPNMFDNSFKLVDLEILQELNNMNIEDIASQYPQYIQMLYDSVIRTTIIDSYDNDLFLYKTFERINTFN